MDVVKKQLAERLAAAITYESHKFEGYKLAGGSYQLPLWYQPAVDALELYNDERSLEQNQPY